MVTVLALLAEAGGQPAQQPGGGGLTGMLVVFGPMILIFLVINHFLVSRPQQKEQARQKELLNNLKKNDRVLTAGGIIGHVVSVSEDKQEITLRMVDDTRIKFRTESIRGLLDKAAAEATEGAKGAGA